MKPIEHQDLSYIVYENIKELILTGELKPGEQIRQEKMASQLGVSRTPLHKAFQMLENEYLVVSIPRRGIFVKEIKLNQVIDAFECRSALESVAARRVARDHTPDDLASLKAVLNPFFNIPADKINKQEYQRADREFHNLLLKLSGNEIIMKIDVLANILVRTYIKGLIREPEETIDEHKAILEAIEKRDEELAEHLTKQHLRRSQLLLNDVYLKE